MRSKRENSHDKIRNNGFLKLCTRFGPSVMHFNEYTGKNNSCNVSYGWRICLSRGITADTSMHAHTRAKSADYRGTVNNRRLFKFVKTFSWILNIQHVAHTNTCPRITPATRLTGMVKHHARDGLPWIRK